MRHILWVVAVVAGVAVTAQPAQACPQEEMIKSFYKRYLHRCAQPCEVAHWMQVMRQGVCAEQVEVEFLGSDEYWRNCGRCADGFVRSLFQDVLGRPACRNDMTCWVDEMRCGCRKKMATKFLRAARQELAQQPTFAPPRVVAPGPVVVPQQGNWSSGYRGSYDPRSYEQRGYDPRGYDPRGQSEQRIRIIYVR